MSSVGAAEPEATILARLETEIAWYDRAARRHQRAYKTFKTLVLFAAAATPVCAGFDRVPKFVLAILGSLVVLFEGLNQLGRHHHNWMTFRSACEMLKHEKYLYVGRAGIYLRALNRLALLTERVEQLVGQEHSRWVVGQSELSIPGRDATAAPAGPSKVEDAAKPAATGATAKTP